MLFPLPNSLYKTGPVSMLMYFTCCIRKGHVYCCLWEWITVIWPGNPKWILQWLYHWSQFLPFIRKRFSGELYVCGSELELSGWKSKVEITIILSLEFLPFIRKRFSGELYVSPLSSCSSLAHLAVGKSCIIGVLLFDIYMPFWFWLALIGCQSWWFSWWIFLLTIKHFLL